MVDDEKHPWKKGDTLCVPAWHKYQHFASDEETVYLYRFDDKPMLEALGVYRVEGQTDESLVTAH
jgi:gentisate 1,2-dioxygenase